MKTKLLVATIFLTAGTIYATSYCFDIVPADSVRVAEAFGNYLGLHNPDGSPRPATPAEVAAGAQKWIESQTQDYERRKNMAAFQPSPVGVSATPGPSPSPTAIKK